MPSAPWTHVAPPATPPSTPRDIWEWIDQQMAQATTPEEHLAIIELIELLVRQEPIEDDEPRT